jgi:hypothetical protein
LGAVEFGARRQSFARAKSNGARIVAPETISNKTNAKNIVIGPRLVLLALDSASIGQTFVAPSPKLKINHGEPPALFGRKPGNQQSRRLVELLGSAPRRSEILATPYLHREADFWRSFGSFGRPS